jgi:transposase
MGTKNLPEGLRGGSAYRGGPTPQARVAVLGGDYPAESADENTEQTLKAGRIDEKLLMGCGTGLPRSAPPLTSEGGINLKTVALALEGIGADGKLTPEAKQTIIDLYRISGLKVESYIKIVGTYAHLPLSKSTFYGWRGAFRRGGVEALTDSRGDNNRKISEACLEMAIRQAAKSRHYTTWFEKYKGVCLVEGVACDVSYNAFVKAAKKAVKTPLLKNILRGGKDSVKGLTPVVHREFDYRNQEWQGDATKVDWMVKRVTQSLDRETGALIETVEITRPTLIMIVDCYSGRRIGYMCESPNSYAQAAALRKAMLAMGKPHEYRTDRGSDYISGHVKGALSTLGISQYICDGDSGDQKGKVERAIQTLQHDADFENAPGFIGHNPGERVVVEKINAARSERKSKAKTQDTNLMTWEEAEIRIELILQKQDEKHGWTKKWEADAKTAVIMPTLEEINRAIGRRRTVIYQQAGARFDGADYLCLAEKAIQYIGQKVEAVENIDDNSRIWLYDTSTKELIGEAKNHTRLGLTQREVKERKRAALQSVKALDRRLLENARLVEGASELRRRVKEKARELEQAAVSGETYQAVTNSANRGNDEAAERKKAQEYLLERYYPKRA